MATGFSTRRRGTGWLLGGYAGLVGFFALEARYRQPGTAASLEATSDDQGTTRLILAAYGVAAVLPAARRAAPSPPLPRLAGPVGLALQAAGLSLRAWAMRALGSSYTRTLRTEGEAQAVVDTGPYRWIRHPGYAGSLLTWTGFALTTDSLPALAAVGSLLGWAYHRRVDAEEELLTRDLPGYAEYRQRTRRVVPYVW